eukprot:9382348-Karenia_brevis.AAC.1
MAQAGALMAIYIGALWPGARMAGEGRNANKCLLCQQEVVHDEVHMFPKLVTNRHPAICETQNLVDTARSDN